MTFAFCMFQCDPGTIELNVLTKHASRTIFKVKTALTVYVK